MSRSRTIIATTSAGTTTGGSFLAEKRVFPVRLRSRYEAESISQRLVDAAHVDDLELALDLISNPFVDVNFIGTVCLKSRKTELVLNGENATEVRVEFEEFKTEVTALFLAACSGNLTLVRKLLGVGANVNQKLFRGHPTTAAVREGHIEVLQMLLNAGAGQAACEESLLEACYLGQAKHAELLMGSGMVRSHVAVNALVLASSRGFIDFVETLIKSGVDVNATARVLLQSSKPSLYANVDCNALVAAVVSRQIFVVKLLLQVGVKTDIKVRLGAWSWDTITGEEFRVGAGLAEPYSVTWCAVEYFEDSGAILRMLLQQISPNIPHLGRTLLHHAILCHNARAFSVLLSCGADIELSVETNKQTDFNFYPIHFAARLGLATIVSLLIKAGCNLNSRTGNGDTALMICARNKQDECLKLLALAGADFGLTNMFGQCASSIAATVRWKLGFQRAVLDVIQTGKIAYSSNSAIFSALLFATRANDIEALRKLIEQPDTDLNQRDESGFSAVMVAVVCGYVEAFQLLVNAGADMEIQNKYGETASSLVEINQNSDAFRKVLTEYAYAKGSENQHSSGDGSSALHRAARIGDLGLAKRLINETNEIDVLDVLDYDGYTPLMLAAREGNETMCELLISSGARCDLKNARNETPLSMAMKGSVGNDAENIIQDELARQLVLRGTCVKKHTKGGKGAPHVKTLKMVENTGVLRWGKSSKRNVICRGAEVGPSLTFRYNRRKKFDADEPGVFRVVTTKNKEIHFACEGGVEKAELWVRGMRLVTREAIFGGKLRGCEFL